MMYVHLAAKIAVVTVSLLVVIVVLVTSCDVSRTNAEQQDPNQTVQVVQRLTWMSDPNNTLEVRIETVDKLTFTIVCENVNGGKILFKGHAAGLYRAARLASTDRGEATVVFEESTGSMDRIEILRVQSQHAEMALSEIYSDCFFFIPGENGGDDLYLCSRSGENKGFIRRYTYSENEYTFAGEIPEKLFQAKFHHLWKAHASRK